MKSGKELEAIGRLSQSETTAQQNRKDTEQEARHAWLLSLDSVDRL
jgi:hypothetical protein